MSSAHLPTHTPESTASQRHEERPRLRLQIPTEFGSLNPQPQLVRECSPLQLPEPRLPLDCRRITWVADIRDRIALEKPTWNICRREGTWPGRTSSTNIMGPATQPGGFCLDETRTRSDWMIERPRRNWLRSLVGGSGLPWAIQEFGRSIVSSSVSMDFCCSVTGDGVLYD